MSKELVHANTVPAILEVGAGFELEMSSVEPIVVLARPAIESLIVPPEGASNGDLKKWIDDSIRNDDPHTVHIAPEPYDQVYAAYLWEVESNNQVSIVYHDGVDGPWTGRIRIGDKKTLWSPTADETQQKIEERAEIIECQDALAQDHPFGDASFIVINEFGGIDYTNPEHTAIHIAFRGLLANHAGVKYARELPGLLHPMLGDLIGTQFDTHMRELMDIFREVSLLSDERQRKNLQTSFEDAVEKSVKFLEVLRPLLEVAVIQTNQPELLETVRNELGPPKRDGRGDIILKRVE